MTVMTVSWKWEETWEGRWWEGRDRKLGVEVSWSRKEKVEDFQSAGNSIRDVERQRTRWTCPHRKGWVEEGIVSKKWKKKQQDVAETAVGRVWRQRERGEAELEMAEEDDEGAVFESDADGQDQDWELQRNRRPDVLEVKQTETGWTCPEQE